MTEDQLSWSRYFFEDPAPGLPYGGTAAASLGQEVETGPGDTTIPKIMILGIVVNGKTPFSPDGNPARSEEHLHKIFY